MRVERFLLSTETVTAMMQHIINWNHYNYYNNITIYVLFYYARIKVMYVLNTPYAACSVEKEVNFKHAEILQ